MYLYYIKYILILTYIINHILCCNYFFCYYLCLCLSLEFYQAGEVNQIKVILLVFVLVLPLLVFEIWWPLIYVNLG